MDFITSLPESEGCDSIMVVVDCYNKYAIFIAAPVDCKVDEVARLFVKHIVKFLRSSEEHCDRPRPSIHWAFLDGALQDIRDRSQFLNKLPPINRWADRAHQWPP